MAKQFERMTLKGGAGHNRWSHPSVEEVKAVADKYPDWRLVLVWPDGYVFEREVEEVDHTKPHPYHEEPCSPGRIDCVDHEGTAQDWRRVADRTEKELDRMRVSHADYKERAEKAEDSVSGMRARINQLEIYNSGWIERARKAERALTQLEILDTWSRVSDLLDAKEIVAAKAMGKRLLIKNPKSIRDPVAKQVLASMLPHLSNQELREEVNPLIEPEKKESGEGKAFISCGQHQPGNPTWGPCTKALGHVSDGDVKHLDLQGRSWKGSAGGEGCEAIRVDGKPCVQPQVDNVNGRGVCENHMRRIERMHKVNFVNPPGAALLLDANKYDPTGAVTLSKVISQEAKRLTKKGKKS